MKITVIQFTIRMELEKRWKSGHSPKVVLTELPFICWFIYFVLKFM